LRKYHHVGIPTANPRENESYLSTAGVYHSGFETSPYGIEWMRFDPDSPLPDLVKTVAHVAFEVDDMESELEGKEVLIEPNAPSEGVTVAFIVDNGAPVEFIEFSGEEDLTEH
jgi:catechol 2,3-dioxygenase-like lactoylglutathione lyase family enzyme